MLSGQLDATQARIEKHLRAIQDRIESRLGPLPGTPAAPRMEKADTPSSESARSVAFGIEDVLHARQEEFRHAVRLVGESELVQTNGDYRRQFAEIAFHFDVADSAYNAYALKEAVLLSDGTRACPPAAVFCGGMANAISLISVSLAVYLEDRLDSILRFTYQDMGRAIVAGGARFAIEESVRIFDRNLRFKMQELVRQQGDSVFAAVRAVRTSMYLYTLTHEVGHILLGHTKGDRPNSDVSRNQEREADSFAASVLSTCPNREFHYLAGALSEALMVWADRAAGDPAPTSHPASRERFINFIKSNREAAEEAARVFGLDQRRLENLLPL